MYYILSNQPTMRQERTAPGTSFGGWIASELGSLGQPARTIGSVRLRKLALQGKLDARDLVHVRTSGTGLCRFFAGLEREGVRLFNDARSVRLGADKAASCAHAHANGIPVPSFELLEDKGDLQAVGRFLELHRDIVIKPSWSAGNGRYVVRLRAGEDIAAALSPLLETPDVVSLLLQKRVPFSRLIRCIVHGGRILADAVTYDVPVEGWKCTVCMNPNVKHLADPPAELLSFAEKIAAAFQAQISYIDVFDVEGEYVLNEINIACTLKHHSAVTGVPLARRTAEHLLALD